MSCDFVAFPFFGAFAPCSDKQFKTKQNKKENIQKGRACPRPAHLASVETSLVLQGHS